MDFIKENLEFWSKFPPQITGKRILIEETDHPMFFHLLGVFSVILNQAQGYTPVWMCEKRTNTELLKSYRYTAEFISPSKLTLYEKIRILFLTAKKFILLLKNKDILNISHDGITYGDFIYDSYLNLKQTGTIEKIDFWFFLLIYQHLKRHEIICKTLQSNSYDAVLVTHPIGLRSGVILRVAKKFGLKIYQSSGDARATLVLCDTDEKDKGYPYKITNEYIDELISIPHEKFEKLFQFVHDKHTSGGLYIGALYAFSKNNRLYSDRDSFNQDFGLDPNKKNIFIMLHAFTDYPHSHFSGMLFKDYFDWFIQTLEFAKKNPLVNWIFKQHPAAELYPLKVSFEDLFSSCPKNVIYINEKKNIDTRSLMYVADVIVTCLGSAGYELPAMAGIPSITAGDTFYSNLGFVIEPKTKDEYFAVLKNADKIKRLSKEKIKRAQVMYIYFMYLSKVDFDAIPMIANEDLHRKDIDQWFWLQVHKQYLLKKDVIYTEIAEYINEVKKSDFQRLSTSIDSIKNLD